MGERYRKRRRDSVGANTGRAGGQWGGRGRKELDFSSDSDRRRRRRPERPIPERGGVRNILTRWGPVRAIGGAAGGGVGGGFERGDLVWVAISREKKKAGGTCPGRKRLWPGKSLSENG